MQAFTKTTLCGIFVFMKVSVLEERTPNTDQKLHKHVSAVVGKLARQLTGGQQEPQYEPASESAVTLGHYIVANLDMARLQLVQVTTRPIMDAASTYTRSEIQEYLHSERYDQPVYRRPQAHAILALYGRNFNQYPAGTDNFMCKFGIFNLKGGERLTQAVPYEWEGPSYHYEYDGMRSALTELFGDDPSVRELEYLARINLGVHRTNGEFNPLRPFNQTAFGANLVPVLDRISSTAEDGGLSFQIHKGCIEQF
jgi:hypothetical protein